MRKHFGLLGFVVLAGLLVGGAMPARAAQPLSYEDPAGDQLDIRPSMDIVKVLYDVRQVNKTGPPSLVIEITLDAPPEAQAVSYHAEANVGTCELDAAYRPGTAFNQVSPWGPVHFLVGCDGDNEIIDGKSLIKGNTIMMSLALDSLPKKLRAGGVLSEIVAFDQIADPATGIMGTGYQDNAEMGPLPTDSAATDKTFKLA